MAIAAGDEVAYHQPNASTAYEQRNADFVFGIAINTDIDVLWSNGNLSEAIPGATCLDKIGAVANPTLAGRRVAFGTANVASYIGTVVRCYTRDLNGGGATISFVLIRLDNGQLIEALATNVTVVTGQ